MILFLDARMLQSNATIPPPVQSKGNASNPAYTNHALFFHTVLLMLAGLIFINNFTVICLYQKHRDLRNWTNYLLICLAATDILSGILGIPLIVASSVVAHYQPGALVIHFLSNVVSDFVLICNVLTLFVIFTERYVSICHAVHSRSCVTYIKIRNSIITVWVASFMLAIVPLTWSYRAVGKLPASQRYINRMTRLNINHSLFVSICCFIIPSVGILFYALALLRMVFNVSGECHQRRKKLAERRKAIFMLVTMFILLLLAWSPLISVRIILDTRDDIKFQRATLELFMVVRFLTSFFNPLLYTLFKIDFRKALLGLLDTCRPDTDREI